MVLFREISQQNKANQIAVSKFPILNYHHWKDVSAFNLAFKFIKVWALVKHELDFIFWPNLVHNYHRSQIYRNVAENEPESNELRDLH